MARRKQPTSKKVAEAIDEMIRLIATGASVRSAAKEVGTITKARFFRELETDQDLQERYHAAKNAGIHALLDANEDDLDDLDAELRERVTLETAEGPIETLPFRQTLFGMDVGRDTGPTVSTLYRGPFPFTGKLEWVEFRRENDRDDLMEAARVEMRNALVEQ